MLPTDRILVVDDEPANTVLLEALLLRWGYEDVMVTNDSTREYHERVELRPVVA